MRVRDPCFFFFTYIRKILILFWRNEFAKAYEYLKFDQTYLFFDICKNELL